MSSFKYNTLCIRKCANTCIKISPGFVHARTNVYTNIFTYAHNVLTHTHKYIYQHIYIHTQRIHTHTNVYTHIFTYTHNVFTHKWCKRNSCVHAYTQIRSWLGPGRCACWLWYIRTHENISMHTSMRHLKIQCAYQPRYAYTHARTHARTLAYSNAARFYVCINTYIYIYIYIYNMHARTHTHPGLLKCSALIDANNLHNHEEKKVKRSCLHINMHVYIYIYMLNNCI
jgi:hypothetical protein